MKSSPKTGTTIATAIVVLVALLAGALWWTARIASESPLGVDNARIRLVPGGAPMAGYMVVRNRGDSALRLVAARSEAFETVMIHRSVVEDGRARMEHQRGGVVISPGESVEFRPGDLHLMLMRPRAALQVGDPVVVVLRFDGLEPAEWPVAFTVVPVTAR